MTRRWYFATNQQCKYGLEKGIFEMTNFEGQHDKFGKFTFSLQQISKLAMN